jgi:uncharacterized membrane protein YphA (DoxX/SURF4 family)
MHGGSSIVNVALWTLQVLLALFFALVSGAPKLILPPDAMPMPIPIPYVLLLFTGVAEVLGGAGLILPGLLRIRPGLTPLAAAGLTLVTIGATVYQIAAGEYALALFPVAVGLLSAFVAYGRWKLLPHRGSARASVLEPAA